MEAAWRRRRRDGPTIKKLGAEGLLSSLKTSGEEAGETGEKGRAGAAQTGWERGSGEREIGKGTRGMVGKDDSRGCYMVWEGVLCMLCGGYGGCNALPLRGENGADGRGRAS